MDAQSKLQIYGTLRVYEFVPGTVVKKPISNIESYVHHRQARKVVETRNLVTDIGLEVLACLIAGGLGVHSINGSGYGPTNFSTLRVQQMHISDPGGPPAPAPGDTALSAASVYEFHDDYPTNGDNLLSSIQLVTSGEVRFSGLVQQHELGGSILTEEGLFTESGELVARTTFSYTKTVNAAVQFDHTLSIVRA